MMPEFSAHDPRGLIGSSFEIEGITIEDCRTIFLDWAMSVSTTELAETAAVLAQAHRERYPDHPMLMVLDEARQEVPSSSRRRKRSRRT